MEFYPHLPLRHRNVKKSSVFGLSLASVPFLVEAVEVGPEAVEEEEEEPAKIELISNSEIVNAFLVANRCCGALML